MLMVEMVLDEFSGVAFMEQDTNFLSYELGLVMESGEISEVFKLHHVQTYICESLLPNNICIKTAKSSRCYL
jgi:hypothetical protein